MNTMYGNNNHDGKRQPSAKKSYKAEKDSFHMALTACIVNIVTAALMIVFSYILISSPASREIYTRFLFLPVSAFAGAFISFLIQKELLINASVSVLIHIIAHLIFVSFSFSALVWGLFYFINAFVGFMAALVVRTFH